MKKDFTNSKRDARKDRRRRVKDITDVLRDELRWKKPEDVEVFWNSTEQKLTVITKNSRRKSEVTFEGVTRGMLLKLLEVISEYRDS